MASPDGIKWLNELDDLYHGAEPGARCAEAPGETGLV